MRDLTYRMAFLACSVTSSNPRVRGGGEGERGEEGRGRGKGRGGREGKNGRRRGAVETWNISYDDGMCGCMTRAMCVLLQPRMQTITCTKWRKSWYIPEKLLCHLCCIIFA